MGFPQMRSFRTGPSYSRPQIASHLSLSIHTVNDYVKRIYAHLGVHSQAELIARFQRGDGGHSPAKG